MSRRGFDHFHAELSVEIGRLVPRYALWLRMQETGCEPATLSAREALHFMATDLDAFLGAEGLELTQRAKRRLERRVRRFDPRHPTPYETMQRMFSGVDAGKRQGPPPRA